MSLPAKPTGSSVAQRLLEQAREASERGDERAAREARGLASRWDLQVNDYRFVPRPRASTE